MNLTLLLTNLQTSMRGYYNLLVAKLMATIALIQSHVNETGNVHNMSKADIGLKLVEDFPPATKTQAVDCTDNRSVLTPLRLGQSLDVNVYTPLADAFNAAADELE